MNKMPVSCPFCNIEGLILIVVGMFLLFLDKGISSKIGIALIFMSYFAPLLKRGIMKLGGIFIKKTQKGTL